MKNLKTNKTFYIWAAASLICMTAIFLFSAKTAEESGELSGSLTRGIFEPFSDIISIVNTADIIDTLEVIIRKSAHFIIFFILGVCVTNTVRQITKNKRRIFWISLGWCSFYGATDEFHQYFVPGRACMWQDWLIDTAGALLGVIAVFFIIRIIDRAKRKKKNKENDKQKSEIKKDESYILYK